MSWIILLKQGAKIIWQFLCVIVSRTKKIVIVFAPTVEFYRPLLGSFVLNSVDELSAEVALQLAGFLTEQLCSIHSEWNQGLVGL